MYDVHVYVVQYGAYVEYVFMYIQYVWKCVSVLYKILIIMVYVEREEATTGRLAGELRQAAAGPAEAIRRPALQERGQIALVYGCRCVCVTYVCMYVCMYVYG